MTSAVPLGNGWFSGTGVISVPFLHNYGIKIKFDRIYVNTLRQITDGKWYSDSKDRAEWIKEKLNSQGMISDGKIPTNKVEVSITNPEQDVVVTRPDGTPVTDDKGANDKNSTEYDGPYTITVTAPDGSKKQITVDNLPANIKDADGNIYTVDNKGKTEKVGKELSGNSKPQPADFAQVWFGNAMVTFSQGDNYAFDSKKDEYKGDYAKVFEPLDVQNSNNATYYVPFKASMAGSSVQVKANLVITNKTADTDKSYVKVKPEHVYFTTGKGVQLLPIDSTVQNANNISYTLKVPAGEARDGVEVYAMVQLNDERPYCIGKLKVVSYAPLTHKVVLVPVGGLNYSSKINISDVERTLKEVYEPIGINFTLHVDDKFTVAASEWDLNNDNKLKVTGSGAFGVLTNEMRALVNAYKEKTQPDPQTAYLFVLEKSDSAKIAGDMPRGKQFGYLFLEGIKKSEAGQLVAHELGHGLFTLQHSWNVLGDDTKKKTDNLMDYSGGTTLTKYQWDMAHNPELAFDWLKDDSEGMWTTDGHYYTVSLLAQLMGISKEESIKLGDASEHPDSYVTSSYDMEDKDTWLISGLQQKYHSLTGGYHGVEHAITSYALLYTHTDNESLYYLLHRFGDNFAHFDIKYDKEGVRYVPLQDYLISLDRFLNTFIAKNFILNQTTMETPYGVKPHVYGYLPTISGKLSTNKDESKVKYDVIDFLLAGIHGSTFNHKFKWEDMQNDILTKLPSAVQNNFKMYGGFQMFCFTHGHSSDGTYPDKILKRKDIYVHYLNNLIDLFALKYKLNTVKKEYILGKFESILEHLKESNITRLDAILEYEKTILNNPHATEYLFFIPLKYTENLSSLGDMLYPFTFTPTEDALTIQYDFYEYLKRIKMYDKYEYIEKYIEVKGSDARFIQIRLIKKNK